MRVTVGVAVKVFDGIVLATDSATTIELGAAGHQQVVYFEREHINVLDAISTIGGLSAARANLQGVLILRRYPSSVVRPEGPDPREEEVIFSFDLTSADGLFAAEGFEIESGDVVLATESSLPLVAQAMTVLRSAAQTVRALTP